MKAVNYQLKDCIMQDGVNMLSRQLWKTYSINSFRTVAIDKPGGNRCRVRKINAQQIIFKSAMVNETHGES